MKRDKAVANLVKDRDTLLTFYDYPAELWKHGRTSNPIESTFATVRRQTKRTKECLSHKTGLAMASKLMMSAQGRWRKLDGQNRLPEIIQGVEFRDGVRQTQTAAGCRVTNFCVYLSGQTASSWLFRQPAANPDDPSIANPLRMSHDSGRNARPWHRGRRRSHPSRCPALILHGGAGSVTDPRRSHPTAGIPCRVQAD